MPFWFDKVGGVRQIRMGVPHNEDDGPSGSRLGSPKYGNYHA